METMPDAAPLFILHREYNLAMKNKSLSYTMIHWSIVTHA